MRQGSTNTETETTGRQSVESERQRDAQSSSGRRSAPSFDLQATQETYPFLRTEQEAEEDVRLAVFRKINHNLTVLFFILTVLCYIDRTNLAFAALQLNEDLGFSEKVYGLGSGTFFFLGYVLFQVPSNLAIVSCGPRLWLGSLVTLWGFLAAMFAAISTPVEFYCLRLALGAAESGTMPGMWYVMSLFYSEAELTVAWAWVLIGISVSQIVGGPLAGGLLALDGLLGLRGWQILFVTEGGLAVCAGLCTLVWLPDSPAKAKFLAAEEREWLQARNDLLKAAATSSGSQQPLAAVARDLRTWHLAAISFFANIPKYGVLFWCPLIIKSLLNDGQVESASNPLVALLTALPFTVSALAIYFNSLHSSRTGERHWHVIVPLLFAALGFVALACLIGRTTVGAFLALHVLAIIWAPDAVMASWPATFLQGPAAATGVALINSVGSVGGMIGPAIIGFLTGNSPGYSLPLLIFAAVACLVALLAFLFPRSSTARGRESDALAS